MDPTIPYSQEATTSSKFKFPHLNPKNPITQKKKKFILKSFMNFKI